MPFFAVILPLAGLQDYPAPAIPLTSYRIMKKSKGSFLAGIIVVFVLTIAVTLVAGWLTQRWEWFGGLSEAREALKSLPMQMGSWEADEEGTLTDESVNTLRIQNSYIYRMYKHKNTQVVVYVTLMVGPSGKITVHTPEICFGGRDYVKDSVRVSVPITVQLSSGDDEDNTFWRVNFTGQSLDVNNRISFYYAVSTGGAWNAVEKPRTTYQKYRNVYKIQAQAYAGTGDEGDSVKQFLEDCLPFIHDHLMECK